MSAPQHRGVVRRPPLSGAQRAARARRRNRVAAALAVALVLASFYAAFASQLPFSSAFVVRAVFSSANELKAGNPVRIAGLPVGSVTGISRGPANTSVVTMTLNDGTNLHTDATASIQPRLLFEGNFYVNLAPGSPAAPALNSGGTLPLTHTSTPVQLDQLLDVLDSPTRGSLVQTLRAFDQGLGSGNGTPGFTALRSAARQLAGALPPVSQLATALQGVHPGDLGNTLAGSADTAAELAAHPAALSDLVSSSASVLAALASGQGALRQDVAGLDRLSRTAPAALTTLDQALPEVRAFAGALVPALQQAPPSLRATTALFTQLRTLANPGRLPALVNGLAPLLQVAPGLEASLRTMFPRLTAVNRCVSGNLVPGLDQVLQDGANTSGYPAWKDLLHLGAALSGASASFDGNGVALRIGVAEGDQTASALIPGFGQLTGSYQGEGVRPRWLGYGVVPPFRPDQPCDRQPVVQVNK